MLIIYFIVTIHHAERSKNLATGMNKSCYFPFLDEIAYQPYKALLHVISKLVTRVLWQGVVRVYLLIG